MKRFSSGSIVVFLVASKLSVTRPSISLHFLLDTQKFLFNFAHEINQLPADGANSPTDCSASNIVHQHLKSPRQLEVESYELLVRRPNFAFVEVDIFPLEEKIYDFSILFFTYFPKR